MNFFKHADNDPHDEIDFPQEFSTWFLMFSILGLELLGEKFNEFDRAFLWWNWIQNPDYLTDHGVEMLGQHFSKEQIAALQTAPRDMFLKAFMAPTRQEVSKTSFLAQ